MCFLFLSTTFQLGSRVLAEWSVVWLLPSLQGSVSSSVKKNMGDNPSSEFLYAGTSGPFMLFDQGQYLNTGCILDEFVHLYAEFCSLP